MRKLASTRTGTPNRENRSWPGPSSATVVSMSAGRYPQAAAVGGR